MGGKTIPITLGNLAVITGLALVGLLLLKFTFRKFPVKGVTELVESA